MRHPKRPAPTPRDLTRAEPPGQVVASGLRLGEAKLMGLHLLLTAQSSCRFGRMATFRPIRGVVYLG